MISICFDEYGQFEKMPGSETSSDEELVFISGLLYDDHESEGDLKNEMKRIELFYKKAIGDAEKRAEKDKKGNRMRPSFNYPMSLHYCPGDDANNLALKYVKDVINKTLPEFISKGTYKGNALSDNDKIAKREGCYHIFSIMKGRDKMYAGIGKDAKLLNDEFASNLYFHMAGRIVNRVIFYNPLYDNMPELSINAPTRTLMAEGIKSQEYREIGYRPVAMPDKGMKPADTSDKPEKDNLMAVMNSDIYRTLIAQEMLRNIEKKISISQFKVNSINYKYAKKEKELLYLSDSLCSYISWQMIKAGEISVGKFDDVVNALNSTSANMVFLYDETDTVYETAWSLYEKEEYYSVLSLIYGIRNKKSVSARYYNRVWFNDLENKIIERCTPSIFERETQRLQDDLFKSNLSQGKIEYILNIFERMSREGHCLYRNEERRSKVLLNLYEAGITAKCHKGDAKGAIDYYNKCVPLLPFAGLERGMSLRNKLCVAFEDLFAWDFAEEYAFKNVGDYAHLTDVAKEIYPESGSVYRKNFGKCISQYARILAAKRNPDAEKYFRRALQFFEKDTADYKITQSYLLHFYLDNSMISKYRKEAIDFFDGKRSYRDRLKYIRNMESSPDSVISKPFAFYVLFRGLYCEANDVKAPRQVTDKDWKCIKDSGFSSDTITGGTCIGHPWEIIFKYLRLLSIVRKDPEQEKYYEEQQANCMQATGNTIDALILFGEAEINSLKGNAKERKICTAKLCNLLNHEFVNLKARDFAADDDMRFQELSELFSFMYH